MEAPVTKGQVLGTVTLSYGDTVYGTVDLLADEDVSASRLLVFQKDVLEFFQSTSFKLGVALFAALLFLVIVLRIMLAKKRRRRRRESSRRAGYRGRRR